MWETDAASNSDRAGWDLPNKSEAECSWIVSGKKYEFCCPPCLDKFMMWAKTKPEKVKDPGEYVKR
jgi:YHS domain-containing protein